MNNSRQPKMWNIFDRGDSAIYNQKLISKITQAKTPIDKVKTCLEYEYTILKLKELVLLKCTNNNSNKDGDKSRLHRAQGNCLFAGSSPELSIPVYGVALRYASPDSPEERLAFSNRSAVFLHFQRFQDCIHDVNRALIGSEGFLRLKLLVRKAKAFHRLKKDTEELMREIKDMAGSTKWDKSDTEKVRKLVVELERYVLIDDGISCDEASRPDPPPEPLGGFNPDFPSASNFVELRESPKKGKYVVAKKNFRIGDIIFVEKPAAYVLLQPFSFDYCQFCCQPSPTFIPCKTCSRVIFCGDECRDLAWKRFHRFECPNGITLCQETGIAHLAFRMTLENLNFPPCLELVNHLNKMDAADQIDYVSIAILLKLYIEREVPEIKADNELSAKILVHIAELISNGHAISEVIYKGPHGPFKKNDNICTEQDVRIATGIFPAASKMNHSCIRQIINCFHGTTLIVKAAVPINAGEEIYNTYGVDCCREQKKDRQILLQAQYFFNCDCQACSAPVDPASRFFALQCPTCHGPFTGPECATCGPPSPQFYEEFCRFRIIPPRPSLDKPAQALSLSKEDLRRMCIYFYKDNHIILDTHNFIALCHMLLGQYVEAFKTLDVCIKMGEDKFGSYSAELGNQLASQADIGINILFEYPELPKDRVRLFLLGRCKSVFERALQLFELHYGDWSEKYCELLNHMKIFNIATKDIDFPQYETEREESESAI